LISDQPDTFRIIHRLRAMLLDCWLNESASWLSFLSSWLNAAIGDTDRERCWKICVYLLTIMRQRSFLSSSLSCDGHLRKACSNCSGAHDNSTDLLNALNRQNARIYMGIRFRWKIDI
jgi:hypothetical protein